MLGAERHAGAARWEVGTRGDLAWRFCYLGGEPADHHPCFHSADAARAPLGTGHALISTGDLAAACGQPSELSTQESPSLVHKWGKKHTGSGWTHSVFVGGRSGKPRSEGRRAEAT